MTSGTDSAGRADTRPVIAPDAARVPPDRLVRVELRKMFNTRSGLWLMIAMGALALLASAGVIAFGGPGMTYGTFTGAVGLPMGILLPIMAILTVTSEWSQRTGLTTFTLVPRRGMVIAAKAMTAVLVGIVAMLLALAVGALGNLIGAAVHGDAPVWDVTAGDALRTVLANVLGLLIGFMLGVLIRNSAGAIVGYFIYEFVIPVIFGTLAGLQEWFGQLQPWIDFNLAQGAVMAEGPTGSDWAHLLVSGLIWLVLPLAVGVHQVMRSEVK